MQLTIGLKRLPNTDGTISVRGKKQIVLEWGPSRFDLLVTMDLYAAGGRHVARLRRNQWTFNDHDRFAFINNQRNFHLVDTQSGRVALRGRVEGRDAVVITEGAFYSAAGQEVEFMMEGWNGATAPQTAPPQATRSAKPLFSPDQAAAIRE